jgi:hypothetical protein
MSRERSGDGASGVRTLDHKTEHALKNHLAVILGFCDLLIAETQPADPRHADLLEMRHAARSLLAIFPDEGDQ